MRKQEERYEEISVKEVKEITKKRLKEVGNTVRQLRMERGLSLNDLSFYCYVSLDNIHKIELGKADNATVLTLAKLSAFFNKDIKELF